MDINRRKPESVSPLNSDLSIILESITDGFFAVDKEWKVTYWNKTAEAILGTSKEAILGKNLWHVYDNAIPLKFYTKYHHAVSNKVSVHFEEYYPPVGKWIEVTAFPSADGLSVYFKDITYRKQAEEEIRLAKERYDLLSKASKDAVWDWDIVNNKIFWGEGLKTLFGYDLEKDHTGDSWIANIHPDDTERVANKIATVLHQKDELRFEEEYRFMRTDGSYAFVLDRGFIIRSEQGEPRRMIGVMQDQTERATQLKAIEEQNIKLKEIAWMQSHLLRAPLSRIMGLVSLLNEGAFEKSESKEILNHINTSAYQLDAVIRKIVQKAEQLEPVETKHLKVLVVDDDEIAIFIHKSLLSTSALSTQPVIAFNGKEALDLLTKEKNSNDQFLVFLDINMPVMDGWEFLDEIEKKLKEDLLVVIVTSSINSHDKEKAKQYKSVIDFIEKPLTITQFERIKTSPKIAPFFN